MQIITVFVAAFSLAGGCHAWASDGRGTWVANNVMHDIHGVLTHEACTRMGDPNFRYQNNEPCGYWKNGQGEIYNGRCRQAIWGSKLQEVRCI